MKVYNVACDQETGATESLALVTDLDGAKRIGEQYLASRGIDAAVVWRRATVEAALTGRDESVWIAFRGGPAVTAFDSIFLRVVEQEVVADAGGTSRPLMRPLDQLWLVMARTADGWIGPHPLIGDEPPLADFEAARTRAQTLCEEVRTGPYVDFVLGCAVGVVVVDTRGVLDTDHVREPFDDGTCWRREGRTEHPLEIVWECPNCEPVNIVEIGGLTDD